jgi:hypothetical protein
MVNLDLFGLIIFPGRDALHGMIERNALVVQLPEISENILLKPPRKRLGLFEKINNIAFCYIGQPYTSA